MTHDRSVRVFAPAKINLTLHVTGQRADGYHLLDSLVAFADVGDVVQIDPGQGPDLVTTGPEAEGLANESDNNLITKVARLFEDGAGAAFQLEKNLPVASGIGGGSADAAAALRGLVAARFGIRDLPRVAAGLSAPLLALGADIPMCVRSEAVRVGGIGDQLRLVPALPALHAVLVNPRRGVPTPAVFRALSDKDNAAMPSALPHFAGVADLISWLAGQRNDLEPAARSVEPAIADVQRALAATEECQLVRMSGSGATCFGLYLDAQSAQGAAVRLRGDHPDWWVHATRLGSQAQKATPQFI